MINVSRVLDSPAFRQTFTVTRSTGHFGAGGWIEDAPTTLTVSGAVWPSQAKEIQQMPEGDRVLGMMTFASTQPLYTTRAAGSTDAGTSDKITWRGELYRLIQVLPFTDYGFSVAVGARMIGE